MLARPYTKTQKLPAEKVIHKLGDFLTFYRLIISEPNPETVAYLKKGLSREYELYDYIKEVFYEKINFLKSNGLWDP